MSARHTSAVSQAARTVLLAASIQDDRVLLPPTQLDRALYQDVMKVLAEFGGKWSRKAKAILIPVGARAKLLAALESGVVQREKVIRQAFYTPDEVADRLVRFALRGSLPDRSVRLLEPSAGGGSLIRAASRQLNAPEVTAVELDADAASNLVGCTAVINRDFLQCSPADLGQYDVCLMNPPFQKGQALKHVQHALRFVRQGGVLAAVVPSSFPETVDGVELTSEELGHGAFKESGTSINTKMIRCER